MRERSAEKVFGRQVPGLWAVEVTAGTARGRKGLWLREGDLQGSTEWAWEPAACEVPINH